MTTTLTPTITGTTTERVGRPTAPLTARTPSSAARSEHLAALSLITELFSTATPRPRPAGSMGSLGVSPQAAYQDVLYRRALLIEISATQEGSPLTTPGLRRGPLAAATHTVAAEHLGELITTLGPELVGQRVLLLAGHLGIDQRALTGLVNTLTLAGAGQVEIVEGGYDAWVAAGLPALSRPTA